MAEQTRLIRLTWENGVNFKMDTKLDDGSYMTIIDMDENGELPKLWDNAQSLCEKFFLEKITGIGADMKA